MRRIILAGGVLAALAGLAGSITFAATPAAANTTTSTVQDGFESPVVQANTFVLFTAGQAMGAWQVTSGDVHLIGAGFWQAAEGVQSLDLDGGQPGAVALPLRTFPLLTYKVSYSLAGNPDAGPAIKTGVVRINGQVAQGFSFDITGQTRADMGYVRKSFLFLASGHSTTLEFASTTNPGGFGPVLDDVKVQTCLLILCP